VKSKYYNYLQEYLSKNQPDIDDLVVPSSMGIDDPGLNRLIGELSNLYNDRSERLVTAKANNPLIIALDQKIINAKRSLVENIKNIVNTSTIAISDIDGRIAQLSQRISKLPATQRQFVGIDRKFKLNDAMYTYLLQKSSEAQITRASNTGISESIAQLCNCPVTGSYSASIVCSRQGIF
jgi:uncharacterized protein involved in exopolysaccharide biosynthesis